MGSEPPHRDASGYQGFLQDPGADAISADFRMLAESVPHLVWMCGPDGTLRYLNARGVDYFGRRLHGSLSSFPSGALAHPDDHDRALEAWNRAILAKEFLSLESRLQGSDGSFRSHLTRAQPVMDARGDVVKWLGTSTAVDDTGEPSDISAFLLGLSTDVARIDNPHELVCTAMVRLRERLGAAQVSLAEIDDNHSEAIVLRQRASDGWNLRVESLPLGPLRSVTSDAEQGLVTVLRDIDHGIDTGNSRGSLYDRWYGLEHVGAAVSTPLLHGGFAVAMLTVAESGPRNWTASEIELTKRVGDIVWPALEKARSDRALAVRERYLHEFVAMLGHELRNPLAPIRSATRVLRAHGNGRPELEWARSVIERQTGHLARLVDDLLDVSRMVRGQIVLHKSSFPLPELIQHAIETSRPLIQSRHHQLHVSPPPALRVDGDLTRLTQMLANLLNNAAKYTDEGGEIWLDAFLEARQIVLRVRDTGPGVAPTLLPHIFDLFTQAERPLDRAQGGLGIGLTLVKLLAELHGGSVAVRNVPERRGAEFMVRLPATGALAALDPQSPGAAPGSIEELAERAAAMRILVVDDNVDAADSIAVLLTIDGFEARSVHSAAAALEAAESFEPRIVLLDIGLPLMDGYEVAQRLRAKIPPDRMRIVALSGYGQPADRERATQAGFDEYLVKPVEPATLTEFLRGLS
jgi:signal transduction histidine kinase/CheY-like chemotaxis protein